MIVCLFFLLATHRPIFVTIPGAWDCAVNHVHPPDQPDFSAAPSINHDKRIRSYIKPIRSYDYTMPSLMNYDYIRWRVTKLFSINMRYTLIRIPHGSECCIRSSFIFSIRLWSITCSLFQTKRTSVTNCTNNGIFEGCTLFTVHAALNYFRSVALPLVLPLISTTQRTLGARIAATLNTLNN